MKLSKNDVQEVFFIDRWIQEGMEKGLQQGLQRESNLVLRQLKRKFDQIDLLAEKQIQTLPSEKLEKLGEDLLDFQTAKDLKNWLKENV